MIIRSLRLPLFAPFFFYRCTAVEVEASHIKHNVYVCTKVHTYSVSGVGCGGGGSGG